LAEDHYRQGPRSGPGLLECPAPPVPSGSPPSQPDLVRALGQLVARASGEVSADGILRDLCQAVSGGLSLAGAGVMMVDGDQLRFVHADPGPVAAVERLQERLQSGPGRDSVSQQRTVVVPDIAGAHQWPELLDRAGRFGLRSVVATPLMARGRSWGVLDLYRSATPAWTQAELAAAKLFADVAGSYIAMTADHDATRADRREQEHRATHDSLTGLPNRALLYDRLEHALGSAARPGTSVAVLFVDIDRFKAINDSRGHAAGDAVLIEVARTLRESLRESDTLARISGDEFVIICENLDGSPDQVRDWLRGLTRRMQLELLWSSDGEDEPLAVTVSIGAAATAIRCPAKELIGRADRAMYEAKQLGGGHAAISR
jgi:diguanylate cyclase (GGDEF)-like protein